jgi:hypothetical protein
MSNLLFGLRLLMNNIIYFLENPEKLGEFSANGNFTSFCGMGEI